MAKPPDDDSIPVLLESQPQLDDDDEHSLTDLSELLAAPPTPEPFRVAPSALPPRVSPPLPLPMPPAVARFIASVPPPAVLIKAEGPPTIPAPPPPMPVEAERVVAQAPVVARAEEAPISRAEEVPPRPRSGGSNDATVFRPRHLIVVGGGRGGVGKSMVAEGLAVYFAQLGKNVVLVDADPNGSNLHAHLGADALAIDAFSDDTISFEDVLGDTEVPGLRLLPYPHEALRQPGVLRGTRKARWLSRLRKLDADYLVVDAGPGNGPFTLDLLLAADVPVLVTTPEPPAVEAVYRFLRASFVAKLRRIVHRDRLRSGMLERCLADFGRLPPPLPFVRALAKMDPSLSEIAWQACQKMAFQLVINQTRLRSDIELGSFMSELAMRRYGVALQELGHVEQDDSVHFAVRRKRSLLIDNPAAKASRNVERLARRVLGQLLTPEAKEERTPPIPAEVPNYYQALGLSRGASDEDARRNFKRRREMIHEDSIATFSLFTKTELRLEQSRLDEAYDTLMDPIRRRAYDLSLFPAPDVVIEPLAAPTLRDKAVVENELARELGPEAEYSGALLRRVREAYGTTLDEVAKHSKIAKNHLAALEDERWIDLPAPVYVRGYVAEFAKFFGLDAMHVQRTYMRRYQAAKV
jgi:flagellar biosynthesis protein FlhG